MPLFWGGRLWLLCVHIYIYIYLKIDNHIFVYIYTSISFVCGGKVWCHGWVSSQNQWNTKLLMVKNLHPWKITTNLPFGVMFDVKVAVWSEGMPGLDKPKPSTTASSPPNTALHSVDKYIHYIYINSTCIIFTQKHRATNNKQLSRIRTRKNMYAPLHYIRFITRPKCSICIWQT